MARLRTWSRQGRKLAFRYVDEAGQQSERVVWPFLVGYVATVRVVIAWCELRKDYRIFRTDRLSELRFLDEHYPEHAKVPRRRWQALRSR